MRSLFALTLRGALLAVFHVRSGFISGAAIKGILERMASIKGGRALCFLRKSSFAATFNFKVVESPKYRPDIDGLRAIAVLPVLLYHAGVAGFSGGYVGVDIFFVISGFLIASIITKDIELKRFSFLSFYERRMRRIFPALFAVALFCVAAATILFEPKDFIQFGKSLMAMAAFISNLFFWRQAGTEGYFGFSSVLALLHTWSLSVEEQFYIFFPVSLILLRRWAKGYASNCLLFVIAASFAVSAWEAIYRPFSAFYLLAPRAWELLIGAFLAMQPMPPLNGRVVRELAGIAGLGMIAYAIVAFDRQTDFPGLNALFPCLGAWLIIYAGKDGASYVKTLLSLSPLVFIGVISYSLYLWHWPIIIFSKHFFVRALSDKETVIVLLCSLLAGFISFVFIESPFRRKESAVSRRQVYGFGIAASIVSITLGFLIYWYQGFPQRYDETTSQIVMKNSTRKSDYDRRCGNFSADVHTIADMDLCKIGSETSHDVLFWGDSQVQQLLPLVERMHAAGKLPGKGFIFAIEVGCPLTEHLNTVGKHFHCDTFANLAMNLAEQNGISTVFIGFSTWWALRDYQLCLMANGQCLKKLPRLEAIQYFLDELSSHIHTLLARGKRVIVGLPFPFYDKSIPDLEIHNAIFGALGSDETASDRSQPNLRNQISSVAKSAGADIYDPRESLCDNQTCTYQVDGVSIYADNSHIAASQTGILETGLLKALTQSSDSF